MAGLATDDAWVTAGLTSAPPISTYLVSDGLAFAGWGHRVEYLGYALLGRIVERVTGARVQTLVTERFLGPLGLAATTWDAPTDGAWARPYQWLDDRWHDEHAPLGDGCFGPMGGLWSTVADVVRWMAFFDDAFPARDGPDDGPLSRASRREQQQAVRAYPSTLHPAHGKGLDAVPARLDAGGYALGLQSLHDLRFGYVVGHAGGLPGYGSHMRWLPGRRVGVVAFGNVTYAPMYALTRTLIEVLDDNGLVPPRRHLHRQASNGAERLVALLGRGQATAGALSPRTLVDLDEEHGAKRPGWSLSRCAVVQSVTAETPAVGSPSRATTTNCTDVQLSPTRRRSCSSRDVTCAPPARADSLLSLLPYVHTVCTPQQRLLTPRAEWCTLIFGVKRFRGTVRPSDRLGSDWATANGSAELFRAMPPVLLLAPNRCPARLGSSRRQHAQFTRAGTTWSRVRPPGDLCCCVGGEERACSSRGGARGRRRPAPRRRWSDQPLSAHPLEQSVHVSPTPPPCLIS
jgi:CubicO group peptidase (beta-lactamase class C family)